MGVVCKLLLRHVVRNSGWDCAALLIARGAEGRVGLELKNGATSRDRHQPAEEHSWLVGRWRHGTDNHVNYPVSLATDVAGRTADLPRLDPVS